MQCGALTLLDLWHKEPKHEGTYLVIYFFQWTNSKMKYPVGTLLRCVKITGKYCLTVNNEVIGNSTTLIVSMNEVKITPV